MPQQVAIVIGTGLGGLPTAQVLSVQFDSVLVLEKDEPVTLLSKTSLDAAKLESRARPGVQQYNQLHALTSKGLQLFDEVFDGNFSKLLQAAGARLVNHYDSSIIHHPRIGLKPLLRHIQAKEPNTGALCTRHLFECTARKLASENPRVQFVYGASVAGLVFGEEGEGADDAAAADAGAARRTVTGVRMSDGSSLSGQLVVDCSGRGSNLPAWLAAAGCKRPRASRVTCNAGYTGWLCKLDPKVEKILDDNGVASVITFAAPPKATACLLMRVEDGMCIASVGGNEGQFPKGHSEEDLLQFAREDVWHPSAGRLLAGSTFLAPGYHISSLASTWRHYEELTLPDGLLVLGDSCSSFNPTYGQGMTVAVIEAVALRDLLSARRAAAAAAAAASAACGDRAAGSKAVASKDPRPSVTVSAGADAASYSSSSSGGSASSLGSAAGPAELLAQQPGAGCSSGADSSTEWLAGLNQEFQKAVFPTIKGAWDLAAGTDMMYKGSTSNEPHSSSVIERVAGAYVMELFKIGGSDAVVMEALGRMFGMLDPPEALMKPNILLRVLAYKTLELTPSPLRRLLQAVLRPCGIRDLDAVQLPEPGSKEAELAELMGWPTAESSM